MLWLFLIPNLFNISTSHQFFCDVTHRSTPSCQSFTRLLHCSNPLHPSKGHCLSDPSTFLLKEQGTPVPYTLCQKGIIILQLGFLCLPFKSFLLVLPLVNWIQIKYINESKTQKNYLSAEYKGHPSKACFSISSKLIPSQNIHLHWIYRHTQLFVNIKELSTTSTVLSDVHGWSSEVLPLLMILNCVFS